MPRAEIACRKAENGFEAEGVVFAEVLFKGADGSHRSATLSLPFAFPLNIEGEYAEADVLVCGLNIRRKPSGETEAEATLKLSLKSYAEQSWAYISELEEGEKREESDSAFSLFIPRVGENLWEVAKRLGCDPEDLEKSNPELEFPVKEGNRIFVYRQVK